MELAAPRYIVSLPPTAMSIRPVPDIDKPFGSQSETSFETRTLMEPVDREIGQLVVASIKNHTVGRPVHHPWPVVVGAIWAFGKWN